MAIHAQNAAYEQPTRGVDDALDQLARRADQLVKIGAPSFSVQLAAPVVLVRHNAAGAK